MSDTYISREQFVALLSDKAAALLSLAQLVTSRPEYAAKQSPGSWTRPLLGDFHAQAARVEELVDAYGARRNLTWRRLRTCVAGIKLFSDVGYKLLHIRLFAPKYRLAPVTPDFSSATESAVGFACRMVHAFSLRLMAQAQELSLPLTLPASSRDTFAETLPSGSLPDDCDRESLRSVEETVVYLATAVLNAVEEGGFLRVQQSEKVQYQSLVPEVINEEDIRRLEDTFHGLQARYDTYVADTNLESVDSDLPVLRGHITVVYHLLEIATSLCHFYERHLSARASAAAAGSSGTLIDPAETLQVLVEYAIRFAEIYTEKTKELCRGMLGRYSVPGSVEVPIPRYRGFHVRPTTLIARIVRHYGAEVRMRLDDEAYDASIPLDLFRANEKLNAEKRREMTSEAVQLLADEPLAEGRSNEELVRAVARRLFEQQKLILYDRALSLEGVSISPELPPEQCVVECLQKLLNAGKIDLELEVMVRFEGDRRVLMDIALLAEQNYGEDDFGNNLALPPELAYLRSGR
ncbi:HPr family phosphocarrier protein [Salinispira pacifica]